MDTEISLRDLVAAYPHAVPILEEASIDYCCHGQTSLAQACAEKGLDPKQLLRSVTEAKSTAPSDDMARLAKISLHELCEHIVHRHHGFTRQVGQEIGRLMPKVRQAHGSHHPELAEIDGLFQRLQQDLLSHMDQEERLVFPYISRLESLARGDVSSVPPTYLGAAPISTMIADHDAAGALMAEMHRLGGGFAPPSDACASFRRLYEQLTALERDLHWHVYLENNILFPRAQELEEKAAGGHRAPVRATA